MILGIGTDMVLISQIRHFLEDETLSEAYRKHTFTPAENTAALARPKPERPEFYASRFAAKEAAYKSLAHLLPEKQFDLRIIETLNTPDGCPYISVTEQLRAVMDAAGVQVLHISITTEGDYACAFVIAEGHASR